MLFISHPHLAGLSVSIQNIFHQSNPKAMMLGEYHHDHPTVLVPPWPLHLDDLTSDISSPIPATGFSGDSDINSGAGDYSPYYLQESLSAFQRYLPSNDADADSDSDACEADADAPVDAYSCDHFRMYEFKVRKCARGRSHDWTECPYAHPGEKARRRDPRKILYSGSACPDFRKGSCKRGDSCEFAHGVFECWLHPSRYRTQPCKDGTGCRRRVCFFAHTPEQLRILPPQSPRSVNSVDLYDGSPMRQMIESSCVKSLPFMSSPASISPPASSPADSPPVSPMAQSLNEMVASLRNIQLGKAKSLSLSSSWNVPMGSPSFGSPRGSMLRPGFCSLPNTPTQAPTRGGGGAGGCFDVWEQSCCEEEPVMERVESGRNIRARMFEKLSKENSLNGSDPGSSGGGPDVGWISELMK